MPSLHSGGCAFIPGVQPGILIALRGSLTRVWEGKQVLEQMAGSSRQSPEMGVIWFVADRTSGKGEAHASAQDGVRHGFEV